LKTAPSGTGGFARRRRNHRRQYPPKGQQAEEFLAAGIAAVSRKSQKALNRNHQSLVDAIARNMLQVKIPAARAVCESGKIQGYPAGVETEVARVATPWPQTHQRANEIEDTAAVRTKTVRTAALGADHRPKQIPRPVGHYIQSNAVPQLTKPRTV